MSRKSCRGSSATSSRTASQGPRAPSLPGTLDAAQRVTGALVDYATEEKKVLVRRAEFEALAEPLARLRDAIARLGQKTRTP